MASGRVLLVIVTAGECPKMKFFLSRCSTLLPQGFLCCSNVRALKCWKSDGIMNRRDYSKIIEEDECSDTEVSCKATSYSVGRMWCKL